MSITQTSETAVLPVLDILLAQNPERLLTFENGLFDALAGGAPLVLCGAGGLGRRTLAGLRQVGVLPVAIADGSSRLWGTRIDGIEVLEPRTAVERHGADAVFIITVWGAQNGDSMRDRLHWWSTAGCSRVMTFLPLYWKFPGQFLPFWGCDLPHRALLAADRIREVAHLWSDDASRATYLTQVKWRLDGDFDGLAETAPGMMYFSAPFFRLRADERFVDCGAFDGDTLRDFLAATDAIFGAYTALEPDPSNFGRLARTVEALAPELQNRIRLFPFAAHDRRETLRFAASGTLSSAIGPDGDIPVRADTLDALLADERPTFIKLDIEGAEMQALAGARGLIRRARPIVAVSVYHRQSHLWEIPELLASFLKDYSYYLVPHVRDGWDLVCYAVPHERTTG